MGAAFVAAQSIVLNVLSVPVTAYIIRGLGPAAYGQWAVAASLVATFMALTNLGLRGAFIRSVAVAPETLREASSEQLGLRILLAISAAGASLGLCLAMGYPWPVVRCTAIGAIGIVLSIVAFLHVDVLQACHDLSSLATIQMVSGLLLTASSVLAIGWGAGPEGLMAAYQVGPLVSALLLWRYVRRRYCRVEIRWGLRRFWALLVDSRYLAAQQCITAASNNAEALVVPKFLGIPQFGQFAAGTMLADRLAVVPDGLATALYPMIARKKDQVDEASRLAVQFLYLALLTCLPLAVIVSILSDSISAILFPRGGSVCRLVIVLTIWSLPLAAIDHIAVYAINGVGKDASQAKASLLSGVATVLICLALTAAFGLVGACCSLVLRFAVRTSFRARILLRNFNPKAGRVPWIRSLSCNIALSLIMFILHFRISQMVSPPSAPKGSWTWVWGLALLAVEGGVGLLAYALCLLAAGCLDRSRFKMVAGRA